MLKQNPKKLPNNKKTPKKTDKVVKAVDNENRNNKDNNKSHKKRSNSSNNKKSTASKTDSVTEIQVSNTYTSIDIEDKDSIGWKSLPKIASTSEDSDTCDTYKMQSLDDNLYIQSHTISN